MDPACKIVVRYPRRRLDTEMAELCYDPVGSHIIELREYYHVLKQKISAKQGHPAKQKASEKTKKRKYQKLNFPIPEFPERYPFSQSFEASLQSERRMKVIKCTGEVTKCKERRINFIKRVLEQTGFYVKGTDSEIMLLEYLSDILDEFLEKFVRQFNRNKTSDPFSENEDLWGPLETTLRYFGIGGISALHTFYYENVAKKHDILYKKCKDLYDQFKST